MEYRTSSFDHKPTNDYKHNMKRSLGAFIVTVLGNRLYTSDKIKVENIDFLIKMIRNFCFNNSIGTRWVDNHLEPTITGLIKKGRKTVDFNYDDIMDMFEEKVLSRYTSDDPFKLKLYRNNWNDDCRPLCYVYTNKIFRINRTYVLTHKDINDIIDFTGMQEYREEILESPYFKYETIRRYFDKEEIPEYEKAVKELCEETGAKYIGIIEQPKYGTPLKEDEAFICDCTDELDGSSFTYMARVRAYSHSTITHLDYEFRGMSRF